MRAPKDFAAGMLFVAIGAAALFIGADYRLGTLLNMGPGYFPRIIGILLLGLGVIVALTSLRVQGGPLEAWRLRPLVLVLGAIVAFGWMLERFGLFAAIGGLILLSGFAQTGRRFWEIPVLIGVLGLVAWLVFILGLGLPIALWPEGGGT